MKPEDRALLFPQIAQMAGYPISKGAKVLDFGCGEGWKLLEQRKLGYLAFGIDVKPRYDSAIKEMQSLGLSSPNDNVVRMISLNNYIIPFDDRYFDLIYSDHVLEHVQNMDESLAEMNRVLKPGGVAVHIFPTRWRLLEAHTKTPLGGVLRSRPWLRFWGHFWLPERFRAMVPEQRIERMANFLEQETSYPSRERLLSLARKHFKHVELREDLLMKAWGGIPASFADVPGARYLISHFHVKTLILYN